MFAEFLFLAVTLLSPTEGETVPTLRPAQGEYLALSDEVRFRRLEDRSVRARLAATGATQAPLRLAWQGETNAVWSLRIAAQGRSPTTFVMTNRTEAYVTNLEIGSAYRWSVTRVGDPAETAEGCFRTDETPPRLLRAGGVGNFRDLGGWRGLDGRRVRQGRILRSAGLRSSARQQGTALFGGASEPGDVRVTPAGLRTLKEEFGVKTEIELRTRREAAYLTASLIDADVRWVGEPFAAYDFIASSERGREPFLRLFREFLREENYPILMHCSGGRDRTGTLAFLLGGILGVSAGDLCRDWEATAFEDESLSFSSSRLRRLLSFLDGYGGNVTEQCVAYALGCGVTPEEIETFRRLMLEDVR